MTKKILYFVLLSVLIMSVGYDIQTGRIQFGSSRINDSTSALMTMNKGALINGDIRSKTDIYIPSSEQLNIGENYIKGLTNNMQYYATLHDFYSQAGTSIATFDSATGITFAKDFIPTWTKNNSSVNAYQYEKTKIVAGKMPSGVGANPVSYAHGITDWHTIKSWTVTVHDDTTNYMYSPGMFYGTGTLYYARIDTLNCKIEVGSAGYSVMNDSVFFRIVYTDFQR